MDQIEQNRVSRGPLLSDSPDGDSRRSEEEEDHLPDAPTPGALLRFTAGTRQAGEWTSVPQTRWNLISELENQSRSKVSSLVQ